MRKHKKRRRNKRNSKKIWILALIISLLILVSIIIYLNYTNYLGRSKIYEIVDENLREAELSSSSLSSISITGEAIKITSKQFNKALDKINSELTSTKKSILKSISKSLPSCKDYVISESGGVKTGVHDLLIIGDGYDPTNDAKELLNFEGNSKYPTGALFSVEPFKNYKTSFDIRTMKYNVKTSNIAQGSALTALKSMITAKLAAKYGNKCGSPENTYYIVVLSKSEFRSVCIPGLPCLISLGKNGVDSNDPALLTHEFAHGFGGLADEYVDTTISESLEGLNNIITHIGIDVNPIKDELDIFNALGIHAPPNCKRPSNKGSWTYPGCGFSNLNYKPTENSIMNNHMISKEFNQESKERLEKILKQEATALRTDSILNKI